MKRSTAGAVLIAAVAAVGYFYFKRERLAEVPTSVSQPSTPEAQSLAVSPVDDAVIDVGTKASPVSPALRADTKPVVPEVLRPETRPRAVRSLEDRLLVGQKYSQQELVRQIQTDEGFTELIEEIAAQASSDTQAAEMTQLYEEQLTEVLGESQSGSELLRVACSARLCALELESPEGSDLTSLSSSMGRSLHYYSTVSSRRSGVGEPIFTRLVLIVDPDIRVRNP
jgi:hypothetical protein